MHISGRVHTDTKVQTCGAHQGTGRYTLLGMSRVKFGKTFCRSHTNLDGGEGYVFRFLMTPPRVQITHAEVFSYLVATS